jgi:serine/threonine protein phosphatase PrpC
MAVSTAGGYLVAVADGAGGTGDGAAAAERVITGLAKLAGAAPTTDWFEALLELDDELLACHPGCQTTGVVAYVSAGRIVGASVSDSSAWLISPAGEVTDLTAHQRRRPLLGSGEALPVIFEAELGDGRLILGSDGLFKYAPLEQICSLAMQGSVAEAADALGSCVRLPSGGFQDDVAVVIVS